LGQIGQTALDLAHLQHQYEAVAILEKVLCGLSLCRSDLATSIRLNIPDGSALSLRASIHHKPISQQQQQQQQCSKQQHNNKDSNISTISNISNISNNSNNRLRSITITKSNNLINTKPSTSTFNIHNPQTTTMPKTQDQLWPDKNATNAQK